ncbi:type I DNA topoisomerase [Thermodesulfatator atlanticus]
MKKGLIIVESPTKVRTIKKIVGKNFEVAASVGHIKDLPKSRLGVKVDNGFEPEYVTIRGKKEVIKKLKAAAKKAEEIYLGPDPDREGEAIAWHIAEELKDLNKPVKRLLLYELTEKGIKEALAKPGELDRKKFESQQARRILDRLVGYNLSPLLWEKVKRGLSAGRVQSVALRLICEREREREAFEPEEYWTIELYFETDEGSFVAKLKRYKGKPVKPKSEAEAKAIVEDLLRQTFKVSRVERKEVKRKPPAPFITSTLQQEAWRRLRFSAKKTMLLAQRLYEGIELVDEGAVGLITYMRTDSVRVAKEAQDAARAFIEANFGKDYLPKKTHVFKSRKTAQEAHEAIRPTSLSRTPESLKAYLGKDELALYDLIFRRFVASQMAEARFERTEIHIVGGDYELLASGQRLVHPGFLALYRTDEEEEANLPQVEEGALLKLQKIDPKQHFTQPPPRYTEASLIRTLEEKGIGRPSTYAQIVSTIKDRGYVETDKGYLKPTELGLLVNDLLIAHFPDIIETGFTARLEEALDQIEEGKRERVELLRSFYETFEEVLQRAKEEMASLKAGVPSGIKCPACGEEMIIRMGRAGAFLACSRYPDCKETRDYVRDEKGAIKVVEKNRETGEVCEKCGRPMVIKRGRFGEFMACSGYPECKNTKPISTGIPCPEEGCNGTLIKRRARNKKIYYRCSNAPKCEFILWDEPIKEECPQCKAPFLVRKKQRRKEYKVCLKCDYKEEL